MRKQDTPAENIGRDFATFVSAHIPDFEPPIDPIPSFCAAAEYSVNDSNALLPIETVRFEIRRSSSLYYASGSRAPTIYGVLFVPSINHEHAEHGQLSSCWEVGILGRAIQYKYFPDGENGVRSSYEPFARVMGRLALFEAAGQLSFRGQERQIDKESPLYDTASVDAAFFDIIRRNKLI